MLRIVLVEGEHLLDSLASVLYLLSDVLRFYGYLLVCSFNDFCLDGLCLLALILVVLFSGFIVHLLVHLLGRLNDSFHSLDQPHVLGI